MDNATYDGLDLTPINTDETYSRLRITGTKVKPNHELQRRAYADQPSVKQDSTKINTKYNIVLIIIMVILMLFTIISAALSMAIYSQLRSERLTFQSTVYKANDNITSMLTQFAIAHNEISQMLLQLDAKINDLRTQNAIMEPQSNCGPGLWYQVAYLNMSDPTQQCPSAWRKYMEDGIRACGRPTTAKGSCAVKCYFTNNQYSRVCGRIVGYQFGSPDAFNSSSRIGLDGISITYEAHRHHIWSYVAGLYETTNSPSPTICPCSNLHNQQDGMPPIFIGDNYYCESGNPNNNFMLNHLYSNDPLWDGQQCEGTCCNTTMTPPWFSVQLPVPTTDTIEVSICGNQRTHDEDTPVELIEIFVQ